MSWLSKQVKSIGKVAKKGLKAVGKGWEAIDDYAAPAIGFALGGPAGAALGSAAARGIGDGKFDPKATLIAGAKGYGAGALGSAAGLTGGQGLKALGSSALKTAGNPVGALKSVTGMGGGGGAGGAVPNLSIGADLAPSVTSAAAGAAPAAAGAGGWMGGLKKVGDVAGGLQRLAQPVLGGLAMYEGYKNDKQAQKLNDEQLQLARQSYGERAPLRTLGRDLMLDQTPPDLSHIYANSSNPFSRRTG